jgi:hypothetical protein
MGWRFRKSFKLFPGVRVNLSKSGLSTTIGQGPFSVNVGPRGTSANISIPGTGISYHQKLSGGSSTQKTQQFLPSQPQEQTPNQLPYSVPPQASSFDDGKTEIRSASTYELTSQNLESLRRLLTDALNEQRQLDSEVAIATQEAKGKSSLFERWNNGVIFKRLRKERFAVIGQEAQEATDKLQELLEQRRLTRISTEIEIDKEILPFYGRVCDAFSRLSTCNRIWDTTSTKRTNRVVERTTASAKIERKPVKFALAQSDLVQCEWRVPYLENANGGDLYMYPGFLLYRVTRESFAVVDCREINVTLETSYFIEEEQVPSDTKVVSQTWKYTNKDGSPDKRFNNNYSIPVTHYATITLTSPTGLNEEYMVSNFQAGEEFAMAWNKFRTAITQPPNPV